MEDTGVFSCFVKNRHNNQDGYIQKIHVHVGKFEKLL